MNLPTSSTLGASLSLRSRFENIEIAERALVDLMVAGGHTSDDAYWIITALREALANAILHGNKLQPEMVVSVRYEVHDDRVEIWIDDRGEGFDPADVPDPTDAANLLRPSGRGIFYMNKFMSHVDIRNRKQGGTAVYMVRDLKAESEDSEENCSRIKGANHEK